MFLVECCFYRGNPGFNFMCTFHTIYHTSKQLKYSTFYGCFLSILICSEDGCHNIIITLGVFQVHFRSKPLYCHTVHNIQGYL